MNRIFDPIDREFQVAEFRVGQALKQAEQRRMIAEAFAGDQTVAQAGGHRAWDSIMNRVRKALLATVPEPVRTRSATPDG